MGRLRNTDVIANQREHAVDRRDTFAGDFVIKELGFFFVNDCRRQLHKESAVPARGEFNPTELGVLDNAVEARAPAGVYVKHHNLRLARPTSEGVPVNRAEGLLEIYTCSAAPQGTPRSRRKDDGLSGVTLGLVFLVEPEPASREEQREIPISRRLCYR